MYASKIYPQTYTVKAVKFQKFMYLHQDANANMSKTQAKCPLYRLLCMRKRLSVSSRVSWETTILSINPVLIVLEASFLSVNPIPIVHE